VTVSCDTTRCSCLQFIHDEGFIFSFDTETANPNHGNETPSLIQIGTTTKVFLIHLSQNSTSFLLQLGHALKGKTLLFWGGNDDIKLRSLTCCDASFFDVQKTYSNKSQLIGIADCTKQMCHNLYTLCKDWTNSGWDVWPLTQGQVRYAALDVVVNYALHVAKSRGAFVFQCDEKSNFHVLHSVDACTGNLTAHGFSFSSRFLGHHQDGQVLHGFDFKGQLFPTLFRPATTSPNDMDIDVSIFVQLLNTAQICCALCSQFIGDVEQGWPKWAVTTLPSFKQFVLLKNKATAASTFSVAIVSQNASLQKAYYCLNMLAAFFQTKADRLNESDHKYLVLSVSSDINCRIYSVRFCTD
jgi:hypothetical protein